MTKMERYILKKRMRTLRRSRCKVLGDQGVTTYLYRFDAMPGSNADFPTMIGLK